MSARPLERLVRALSSGTAAEADQPRLRKFVLLVLVIGAASLLSFGLQAVQSKWQSAVATAAVVVDSMLVLALLRRGLSLTIVAPIFLSIGIGAAAWMGVHSGREGLTSVFWMSGAPLIALAFGGRRAGYATLAVTLAVMALSMASMEYEWFEPYLRGERTFSLRLFSLLAAAITFFFIVRAYELETERSIQTLEQRNQALIEARAEADRASRAKSEFLAVISHEIRTPLNGVTGMAALLSGESNPARIAEGLRIMQQSADSLLAVINDVLDFSKIESNRLELEAVAYAPKAELQMVVGLMQSRASERGTDLELTASEAMPAWLLGDPTRVRQVALNLISNAVKFTEGGRVTVRLDASGDWLELEVADTGIGMDAAVVERLFTPFAQADLSTTRRFGGTGLGLVITRRLVEAMGGVISVESQPGVGSRFLVRLPIVRASAPPVPPRVQSVRGPKRRVLLVEDNPVNQLVARKLLESLGHEVTLASDGAQALETAKAHTFDLILMDCHMPAMDGYDATRALRASGCATPIYALTAAVSVEDRQRCLSAGMNDVLAKPLRLERLAAVLDGLGAREVAA